MKKYLAAAACLTLVVAVGNGLAANNVKSGPQVGEQVPGPFHPLNVTGAAKGEKHCLYCENGQNPVAMIFARGVSPELSKLIKQVDAATVNNKGAKMGSFVVFLNDDEALKGQLESLASKEGLKSTVLSIDNPAGPKGYNVAKDADVTVVLYENRTVRSNHSFRKGQLNEKAITQIINEVPKIVTSR